MGPSGASRSQQSWGTWGAGGSLPSSTTGLSLQQGPCSQTEDGGAESYAQIGSTGGEPQLPALLQPQWTPPASPAEGPRGLQGALSTAARVAWGSWAALEKLFLG